MGIENGGTFRIGGETIVHRLGFGAMRLSGLYPREDVDLGAHATMVLRHAVSLGIDLIDTAECYWGSEVQIANALAPYPPHLVIASKCGRMVDLVDGRKTVRENGSPAEIRTSIEGALQRLKLDRITLYQLHRIDPAVPMEESVGELARLRDEGKIQHIGLSEVGIAELDRARAIAPIATVQNRYNAVDRFHEPVLDYCAANGIGFLPWFPMGSGNLSAADGPLAELAAKHGVVPGQIAIAWLLRHSPMILPIPGTTSIKHLEDNVAACDIALDEADMAAIDTLADYRALPST